MVFPRMRSHTRTPTPRAPACRDRFADFLLIIIRDVLATHPSLRIVLMSATLHVGDEPSPALTSSPSPL